MGGGGSGCRQMCSDGSDVACGSSCPPPPCNSYTIGPYFYMRSGCSDYYVDMLLDCNGNFQSYTNGNWRDNGFCSPCTYDSWTNNGGCSASCGDGAQQQYSDGTNNGKNDCSRQWRNVPCNNGACCNPNSWSGWDNDNGNSRIIGCRRRRYYRYRTNQCGTRQDGDDGNGGYRDADDGDNSQCPSCYVSRDWYDTTTCPGTGYCGGTKHQKRDVADPYGKGGCPNQDQDVGCPSDHVNSWSGWDNDNGQSKIIGCRRRRYYRYRTTPCGGRQDGDDGNGGYRDADDGDTSQCRKCTVTRDWYDTSNCPGTGYCSGTKHQKRDVSDPDRVGGCPSTDQDVGCPSDHVNSWSGWDNDNGQNKIVGCKTRRYYRYRTTPCGGRQDGNDSNGGYQDRADNDITQCPPCSFTFSQSSCPATPCGQTVTAQGSWAMTNNGSCNTAVSAPTSTPTCQAPACPTCTASDYVFTAGGQCPTACGSASVNQPGAWSKKSGSTCSGGAAMPTAPPVCPATAACPICVYVSTGSCSTTGVPCGSLGTLTTSWAAASTNATNCVGAAPATTTTATSPSCPATPCPPCGYVSTGSCTASSTCGVAGTYKTTWSPASTNATNCVGAAPASVLTPTAAAYCPATACPPCAYVSTGSCTASSTCGVPGTYNVTWSPASTNATNCVGAAPTNSTTPTAAAYCPATPCPPCAYVSTGTCSTAGVPCGTLGTYTTTWSPSPSNASNCVGTAPATSTTAAYASCPATPCPPCGYVSTGSCTASSTCGVPGTYKTTWSPASTNATNCVGAAPANSLTPIAAAYCPATPCPPCAYVSTGTCSTAGLPCGTLGTYTTTWSPSPSNASNCVGTAPATSTTAAYASCPATPCPVCAYVSTGSCTASSTCGVAGTYNINWAAASTNATNCVGAAPANTSTPTASAYCPATPCPPCAYVSSGSCTTSSTCGVQGTLNIAWSPASTNAANCVGTAPTNSSIPTSTSCPATPCPNCNYVSSGSCSASSTCGVQGTLNIAWTPAPTNASNCIGTAPVPSTTPASPSCSATPCPPCAYVSSGSCTASSTCGVQGTLTTTWSPSPSNASNCVGTAPASYTTATSPSCPATPCPPCSYSLWAPSTTPATVTGCKTGIQTITRTATNNGANDCTAPTTSTVPVGITNTSQCPPCSYSAWTPSGPTTITGCKTGIQAIGRSATDGGKGDCTAPTTSYVPVGSPDASQCPPCSYSAWTPSGPTTVTGCKTGIQAIGRTATDGGKGDCTAPTTSYVPVGSPDASQCAPCGYTPWSNSAPMSITGCLTGNQTQTRSAIDNGKGDCAQPLLQTIPVASPNSSLCPCTYDTNWSYTPCSIPCGGGMQTGQKNLVPGSGLGCPASIYTPQACNTQGCPPCSYGSIDTSSLSSCSVPCGSGMQYGKLILTNSNYNTSCPIVPSSIPCSSAPCFVPAPAPVFAPAPAPAPTFAPAPAPAPTTSSGVNIYLLRDKNPFIVYPNEILSCTTSSGTCPMQLASNVAFSFTINTSVPNASSSPQQFFTINLSSTNQSLFSVGICANSNNLYVQRATSTIPSSYVTNCKVPIDLGMNNTFYVICNSLTGSYQVFKNGTLTDTQYSQEPNMYTSGLLSITTGNSPTVNGSLSNIALLTSNTRTLQSNDMDATVAYMNK